MDTYLGSLLLSIQTLHSDSFQVQFLPGPILHWEGDSMAMMIL